MMIYTKNGVKNNSVVTLLYVIQALDLMIFYFLTTIEIHTKI